jgi:hypothetical protein
VQLLSIDSVIWEYDRGIREVCLKGSLTLKGIVVIDLSMRKVLLGGVRSGSENFFLASGNRLASHWA